MMHKTSEGVPTPLKLNVPLEWLERPLTPSEFDQLGEFIDTAVALDLSLACCVGPKKRMERLVAKIIANSKSIMGINVVH